VIPFSKYDPMILQLALILVFKCCQCVGLVCWSKVVASVGAPNELMWFLN
jgi:hypothetical protein